MSAAITLTLLVPASADGTRPMTMRSFVTTPPARMHRDELLETLLHEDLTGPAQTRISQSIERACKDLSGTGFPIGLDDLMPVHVPRLDLGDITSSVVVMDMMIMLAEIGLELRRGTAMGQMTLFVSVDQ